MFQLEERLTSNRDIQVTRNGCSLYLNYFFGGMNVADSDPDSDPDSDLNFGISKFVLFLLLN